MGIKVTFKKGDLVVAEAELVSPSNNVEDAFSNAVLTNIRRLQPNIGLLDPGVTAEFELIGWP